MKRAEFLTAWTIKRRRWLRDEVRAGNMRVSEAAMASATAEKDAANLWRKVGRTMAGLPVSELETRADQRDSKPDKG